jgi:NAD(P)-dependent dehydrogenase (short-subunit alcohol dehydrogenase family)
VVWGVAPAVAQPVEQPVAQPASLSASWVVLPAASYITGAVIPVDGGLMARNA